MRGVTAVLGAVAELAGEELTRRLMLQLPGDYDIPFGFSRRA
ncbi:hypothetical protein [Streptomyces sp. TLI_235]|nr:hypothetical protein [Streptomyces sp. TLI_235]